MRQRHRLPRRRTVHGPRRLLGHRVRHPDPGRAGTADHGRQRAAHPHQDHPRRRQRPDHAGSGRHPTDKDVLIVPYVLANAGGVTVSYFEWVQDFSSFFWSEDEINARLTRIMQEAFNAVWAVAQEKKVTLRTATFILACTRVLQAREVRGLYP